MSVALRGVGWLLCMLAVWVAASAAGAWASLWPVVVLAVLGVAIDGGRRRWVVWIAGDLLAVLLSGLVAIPPVDPTWLLVIAVLVAAIGFGIDWLCLQLSQRGKLVFGSLPILIFGLIGIIQPTSIASGFELLQTRFGDVAFLSPFEAIRSDQTRETAEIHPTPTPSAGGTTRTPITTPSASPPVSTPTASAVPEEPTRAPAATPTVPPEEPTREATTTAPLAGDGALDKVGKQWAPYLEWSLPNPSYAGNPYDLVASVAFVHDQSGETRTTEMFYDGEDTWKFRFAGTRTGTWTFTTESDDPELDGKKGTVVIEPNPDTAGFITNIGEKWAWMGTNKAFVPQLVMYSSPDQYHNRPDQIDRDIQTFLVEHGFNGFHTTVYCRWFDIEQSACSAINEDDPNPDPRTFEALELLITKAHAAGGMVHIWAWGDDSRSQNPKRWGINGQQDKRLQRYIAARLGALPGWTMGYGYDLYEWIDGEQLNQWHDYLEARLGWPHLLGARASKNQLSQLSEALEYSSYEQHKPTYDTYVETIEQRPGKPSFSEDRFRIRDEGRSKDYGMEETRRGLWHSTMAGGVANIWGNLIDASGASRSDGASAPYPQPEQIRTYADFFEERFTADLGRCNELTDGACLQRPNNRFYIFYQEDTAIVRMDLSEMEGKQRAVAVDTKLPYEEIEIGVLDAQEHIWSAPYESDWAIAVGDIGTEQ